MKSKVKTPATENASKKSPPFRQDTPGSCEITPRNDAGLNVGDSGCWLDHRWMEGCRLRQPSSRFESEVHEVRTLVCYRIESRGDESTSPNPKAYS